VRADRDAGRARTNRPDDALTLVPSDDRRPGEEAGPARHDIGVRKADTYHLHQDLTGTGAGELDGFDDERFSGVSQHRRVHLHQGSFRVVRAARQEVGPPDAAQAERVRGAPVTGGLSRPSRRLPRTRATR
jgi:hypothetical protein